MSIENKVEELEVNLKSSLNEWTVGEYVTQIYHFVGGIKRTYNGIELKSIRQGQFTKFRCKNGALVMIGNFGLDAFHHLRRADVDA